MLVPYETILKSGREDRTTLWYVASTSLEMGLLLCHKISVYCCYDQCHAHEQLEILSAKRSSSVLLCLSCSL
jgi:hypothetical protein